MSVECDGDIIRCINIYYRFEFLLYEADAIILSKSIVCSIYRMDFRVLYYTYSGPAFLEQD